MSTPLAAALVRELDGGGRLRFDAYVERCLYDPEHGFYTAAGGSAGRAGDFLTSPEVGPLFGAVLARALDRWWVEAGRPAPFLVVDAGAGPGALLRSLLAAAPACSAAWHLVAVERSPVLRQRHRDLVDRGVDSRADLPSDLDGAVVVANELLDNLAFRVLERAGEGWFDLVVIADGARLALRSTPAAADDSAAADRLVPGAGAGARIPWLSNAARWVSDVLAAGPRRLVVVDYGAAATSELASRPWTGWVRTYRGHARSGGPLDHPGQADLTVDVAADQLPPGAAWTTQDRFLADHGIHDLVAEGRRQWAEHATAPDLAALRGRSRIREAEALLDPDGLGSWLVAQWVPDVPPAGTGAGPGAATSFDRPSR
jgi:SAM-dependent MidA family methyltransferase